VEALAAGTPVVATRTTPWEILEPAGVGHWVAPQAEDLVSASRELLARQQDAGDRQALAARCRQLVQARFGWEQAERQMRQLYQAALNHLNRPRQTSRRGSPALRPPLV
jgi:glycosyltransferase involved in cell wall biosynthesis